LDVAEVVEDEILKKKVEDESKRIQRTENEERCSIRGISIEDGKTERNAGKRSKPTKYNLLSLFFSKPRRQGKGESK
jgi:hypothetical protein